MLSILSEYQLRATVLNNSTSCGKFFIWLCVHVCLCVSVCMCLCTYCGSDLISYSLSPLGEENFVLKIATSLTQWFLQIFYYAVIILCPFLWLQLFTINRCLVTVTDLDYVYITHLCKIYMILGYLHIHTHTSTYTSY